MRLRDAEREMCANDRVQAKVSKCVPNRPITIITLESVCVFVCDCAA